MKNNHIPLEKIIQTFEPKFLNARERIQDQLFIPQIDANAVGYHPEHEIPYWDYDLAQSDQLAKMAFISYLQMAIVKGSGRSFWGAATGLMEIILELLAKQQLEDNNETK